MQNTLFISEQFTMQGVFTTRDDIELTILNQEGSLLEVQKVKFLTSNQ